MPPKSRQRSGGTHHPASEDYFEVFCHLRGVLSSDEASEAFLRFAAGTHDVGKATQHFAFKAYAVGRDDLADAMVRRGLEMPTSIPRPVPHGALGQAHLQSWLCRRYNADPLNAIRFGGIVGGHHGSNPSGADLDRAEAALNNEPAMWRSTRDEILDGMAEVTGADRYLSEWLSIDVPATIQVLATGIIIMADWIASDERLFPYGKPQPTSVRVSAALQKLRLPSNWTPTTAPTDINVLFAERFPHLAPARPNPMQKAVVR